MTSIPYNEMEHPLPVGTRCRLTRAHVEVLRREGLHLSEADQTFTIVKYVFCVYHIYLFNYIKHTD